METIAPAFPAQHKWDRAFFLANTIMAWIAIIMGFGPQVSGHFTGQTPFPPLIVHLHSAAFIGWLILFSVQVLLIRSRRIDLHKKLGLTAVVLAPLMIGLGVATNVVMQREHFEAGHEELAFMIVPFADMLVFAVLISAGLWLRKSPAAHKRLLLLATLGLLDAGFGRWIGPGISTRWGDGYFGFLAQIYLGTDLMLAAAMIYDFITRRYVHPAYLQGGAFMLVVQAAASAVYHWPAWVPVAQKLIGH